MTANRIDHCESMPPGQKLLAGTLRRAIRVSLKPFFNPHTPIWILRGGLNTMARISRPASGVTHSQVQLAEVASECWLPEEGASSDGAILYLHGGAYIAGGPQTHRGLASHLARACGQPVWVPDYRLAPEHPFPAALEDALSSYLALLEQDFHGSQITIAGDSAGGGLTLALALRLRDEGLPLPGKLVALSPWADLTLAAQQANEQADEIMLTWPGLERGAQAYAGDQRKHPWVSPIHGDLTGLPPLLIITGSDEILLPDSEHLANLAQACGQEVHLAVYQGFWHVFPAHAGVLHAADDAMARISSFIHGEERFPAEAAE